MSNKAFSSLRSAESASEYARANRPYAPLPEGESAPTMAQLWAYAHRRYARFQGYAWGGVVIVGAVAWGASRVMGAEPPRLSAVLVLAYLVYLQVDVFLLHGSLAEAAVAPSGGGPGPPPV